MPPTAVPTALSRAVTPSIVKATYRVVGGRTFAARVHEAGSLRLRHPRGEACEGIIVNTSGGIVTGDRLAIEVAVDADASVTLTTAAAEKIYRSDGASAHVATKLVLGSASCAAWIPQETIVFDGARLRRTFDVDLEEDACLVASEIVVFGRAASGERDISGSFHDSWRVRRAGTLVFADETRLDGAIGAILARAAVANGAGAAALLLIARPDASACLDLLRAAIDTVRDGSADGGASLRDGIIVARLISQSSELLRRAVADMLRVAGGIAIPRVWQ